MIASVPSYDATEALARFAAALAPGARLEHVKETQPYRVWKIHYSVPALAEYTGDRLAFERYVFRTQLDRFVEVCPAPEPKANVLGVAVHALALENAAAARLMDLGSGELRDLLGKPQAELPMMPCVEALQRAVNARLAALMHARECLSNFIAARGPKA